MDILILNILNRKYFNGIEDKNLNIYDKFFKEKKGANPEIYNFQDYNGNCYGYISAKDGIVDFSKISFKDDNSLLLNNCLVLWVFEEDNKYKLIGWYKNAQVFKYLQKKISLPSIGRDLYFNIKAKSSDCFLLNPKDRNFILNIEFPKDFNILLKKEDELKEVLDFINTYKESKFNLVFDEHILEETIEFAPSNPISLAKRGSIYMYNERNFLEAIKFFNSALIYKSALSNQEILNIKYERALALQMLNCFKFSIKEFEELLEILNYNFNIYKDLMYLYFVCEQFEDCINIANKILDNEEKSKENKFILEEISCFKAECLIYDNKIDDAKKILNDVIKYTENEHLKINCKNILTKL